MRSGLHNKNAVPNSGVFSLLTDGVE